MRLFGTIVFTLAYYAVILIACLWFGFKGMALVILASIFMAIVSALVEGDDCEDEDDTEHDSCIGCKHNLGGGHCAINLEDECAAGGGYEAWED